MKIAVIGAGAIGGLVAGYLKLKGEDVYLVGRQDSISAIREHGLKISGARGDFKVPIHIYETLISKPDILILATKTQDIDCALKDNKGIIQDASILTIQNGIRAEEEVAKYTAKENIISSIVMFGSTYVEPGKIVHNFEGSWIIGKFFGGALDEREISLSMVLDKAFSTTISQDIKGMKYLKLFVNANNCIPAILGLSMQESFQDLDIARLSIAIWKEGFDVISKMGISLVSLPGFPVENITKLTSMPSIQAAAIFSGIMTKLSVDPVYGSILQSIKRGKVSEVDYINGEFVRLAEENNLETPLNKKLVSMVHQVEITQKFFSKQELMENTKELFS